MIVMKMRRRIMSYILFLLIMTCCATGCSDNKATTIRFKELNPFACGDFIPVVALTDGEMLFKDNRCVMKQVDWEDMILPYDLERVGAFKAFDSVQVDNFDEVLLSELKVTPDSWDYPDGYRWYVESVGRQAVFERSDNGERLFPDAQLKIVFCREEERVNTTIYVYIKAGEFVFSPPMTEETVGGIYRYQGKLIRTRDMLVGNLDSRIGDVLAGISKYDIAGSGGAYWWYATFTIGGVGYWIQTQVDQQSFSRLLLSIVNSQHAKMPIDAQSLMNYFSSVYPSYTES